MTERAAPLTDPSSDAAASRRTKGRRNLAAATIAAAIGIAFAIRGSWFSADPSNFEDLLYGLGSVVASLIATALLIKLR
jgi:hypothetical protein